MVIGQRVQMSKDNGKKHVHYWVLPIPNGQYCIGRCKLCGERKRFSNTVDSNMKYGRWGRPTVLAERIEMEEFNAQD